MPAAQTVDICGYKVAGKAEALLVTAGLKVSLLSRYLLCQPCLGVCQKAKNVGGALTDALGVRTGGEEFLDKPAERSADRHFRRIAVLLYRHEGILKRRAVRLFQHDRDKIALLKPSYKLRKAYPQLFPVLSRTKSRLARDQAAKFR